MTAWADLKASARGQLHEFMGLSANFYTPADNDTAYAITVRVHSAPKLNGDLAGTNLSYAETMERPTTVVFLNSQLQGNVPALSLARGCKIILAATEGYHVENIRPPDGLTTTCEVTPLNATELALLTPPGV